MLASSIQATCIGRYDSDYGRSKKAGEELLFDYSKETGALLMEDFVSRTVYAPRTQVVVKLLPKPTEETEPTEPEVTDPTEETESED